MKLSDRGSVSSITPGYEQLRRLNETEEIIWAPSATELNNELVSENVLGQGNPYPVYTNNASRIKVVDGEATNYYIRSTPGWNNQWAYISRDGSQAHSSSTTKRAVCFGFCL